MHILLLKKKYMSLTQSVKASLWFVICGFLQKGIAFLTTPFFTRLMTTEQYGQVTIYNSWVEVFTIIATLNLFYGVYNNALTKYPDDRDVATSSMLGLCTFITVIIFCFYLFFQNLVNRFTKMPTAMTCILFAEVLFIPAFRFWAARKRFEFEYKQLVILTLLISLLTAGLGFPVVLLSEKKGFAKIITSVVSELAVSVFLYIYIFKNGRVFYTKKYWKWALSFNLPLIPHYLSAVVLNQSDRIMINGMVGTSEAGIYGLAYTVGALVIIFNEAIMNSFTPWTYQCLKKGEYKKIKKVSTYLVLITAIITLSLVIVSPEIMFILGGEKYKEGTWIIAPIAASFFFRFLYSIYANVEFYYEKNYFIMIASVITAVLNILLNYIFIRLFGYLAAGFTTLACFSMYAFSHFFFYRYIAKMKCKTDVYNNRIILCVSISLIILCTASMLLFNFWYIRYPLLLLSILMLVINRRKVVSVFMQIRNKSELI